MKNEKIITTAQVNRFFSSMVGAKLNSGMVIHSNSMRGSQGELSKVDLTDGKDVYRLMLDRDREFTDDDRYIALDVISFYVLKFENAYSDNLFWGNGDTLWNKDDKVVTKCKFYNINPRGREPMYTTDKEFAIECQEKRQERYGFLRETKATRNIVQIPPEQAKKLCKFVNQHKGYKSVSWSTILMVERLVKHNGYRIHFANHRSPITITFGTRSNH